MGGNKNFVGDSLLGGFMEVGGGMSGFLAGRGWTFCKTMMQDKSNYTKCGMRCNTSSPRNSALTSFENDIFITFWKIQSLQKFVTTSITQRRHK